MKIQKIITKISKFLSIKKRNSQKKGKGKIFLNNNKKQTFKNKRKNINIKNIPLDKFKIFGNNIRNYYYAIILLLFVIGLYIFFGPIFKIKSIEIIRQDNISNMQIAYKSVEMYRGKSIFQIDKKDILQHLQDYQHNINDISTTIVPPSTLKIVIGSSKGAFNTIVNDKNFIITENGTLIPSEPSESLNNLTLKNQFEKNKFFDYKKTLDSKYLYKILSIINSVKENIINLQIKNVTYFIIEREVHIETDNNITIIFDLDGNYREQVEKLAVFNKDYLEINKNALVYIDLRIKNKIFYCSVENEYQCIKNLKSIYPYE